MKLARMQQRRLDAIHDRLKVHVLPQHRDPLLAGPSADPNRQHKVVMRPDALCVHCRRGGVPSKRRQFAGQDGSVRQSLRNRQSSALKQHLERADQNEPRYVPAGRSMHRFRAASDVDAMPHAFRAGLQPLVQMLEHRRSDADPVREQMITGNRHPVQDECDAETARADAAEAKITEWEAELRKLRDRAYEVATMDEPEPRRPAMALPSADLKRRFHRGLGQ